MLGLIKADNKANCPAVDEQPRVGKEFGVNGWLLGALYLSELSLLLILLTSYVVQRKPTFLSFLNSRPGYVFITGIAGLLASGMIMRRQWAGPAKADVRSASVYAPLTFPTATIPYAAPRFVMRDQQLTLLNVPLPPPEQIFSARTIDELPYIEWDRSYVKEEWDRPAWTIPTRSYLFRWLDPGIRLRTTCGLTYRTLRCVR